MERISNIVQQSVIYILSVIILNLTFKQLKTSFSPKCTFILLPICFLAISEPTSAKLYFAQPGSSNRFSNIRDYEI